ncbi:MAG: hypothetical protein Q4G03_10100 [Planctomycetia bacterium]|nr:hypothetical protein [Planctomycetia bacterium]
MSQWKNGCVIVASLCVVVGVCVWQTRGAALWTPDYAANATNNGYNASRSNRLLSAAILQLEQLDSLSASMTFSANFFGTNYRGEGKYRELSARRAASAASRKPLETNFSLRATAYPRLDAKNTDQNATNQEQAQESCDALEIVCDCQRGAWWRYDSVLGEKNLKSINIEELANSLAQLDDQEADLCLRNNGIDRACGMNGLPGLGGLAGTLKRLSAYYQFDPEVAAVISGGGVKSYKIVGKASAHYWNAIRKTLQTDEFTDDVLENIPEYVEAYFGVDWPFPYKIVYYTIIEKDKKRIRHEIFSVQYSDVKLNDPNISLEEFEYIQPQLNFERVNNDYLEELTQ